MRSEGEGRVHLARIDGARWHVDAEEPASIE